MKRRINLRSVAMCFLLSAFAYGVAQTPEHGGTLVIASDVEPFSFDTRANMGTAGLFVGLQIYEGLLTTIPETGEPGPGLAESWEISEDGLTYTFHLRQGVRFHDGSPFTSDDVRFTFEYLTGEKPGSIMESQYSPFLERIETPDDYTAIIHLSAPWEDFEMLLHRHWATLILSRSAVEAAGEQYGNQVVVGTGPFRLSTWEPGESIVVERNPDYWQDGLPYLDRIVMRTVRDGSVRMLQVQTGAAHIALDPPEIQLPVAQSDPNLDVVVVPGNAIVWGLLNTTAPPFDDARVRRAVQHALNRYEIVEAQYGENASVMESLFPGWHWMHDSAFRGLQHDPELARQLLTEAGYSEGNPLRFTLMVATDSETNELGVMIQAQLAEVGIDVDIRQVEASTRLALIQSQDYQERSQYQASIHVQTPSGSTDDYMFKWFHSEGNLNRTYTNREGGASVPGLDEAIAAARATPRREEARAHYQQALELIIDAAPMIPLAIKNNVNVVRTNVEDYFPQGVNTVPLYKVWLSGE